LYYQPIMTKTSRSNCTQDKSKDTQPQCQIKSQNILVLL